MTSSRSSNSTAGRTSPIMKPRRVAKYSVLVFLTFLLLVMGGALEFRAYRQREARKAMAIATSDGIDEGLFVQIGGVDQWLTIRGQNRENPVLLVVHGGPGVAMSPFALFTRGWERDFTLVHWDQRGAGKTFGRSGSVGNATIEQMAQDGIEVVQFILGRLHKRKIVLLGWSWGTVLGIPMAKVRPDLFYAYVGTGQVVNELNDQASAYARLLSQARSRQDRGAIRRLETIGPPPWNSQSDFGALTRQAFAYEPGAPSVLGIVGAILIAPRYSLFDSWNWLTGLYTSQEHWLGDDMRGPFVTVDLRSLGESFAIPMFVFQGEDDNITPAQVASAYVDSITAPHKCFVALKGGGHLAMVLKSDEFLKLLVERVRPLANDTASVSWR